MAEKKKPRSTVRDHEFYFTKRFTCPTCGEYLASYDFGRAGMAEGLSRAERINCPKCEQRIDWSGVAWPEPIQTAEPVAAPFVPSYLDDHTESGLLED